MKTYTIEIFVPEYIINNWEDSLEWQKQYDDNEEDIAYIEKVLNKLYKWSSAPVEVSSLEEYFALVEEVCDVSDGEYHICNCGHGIFVGE